MSGFGRYDLLGEARGPGGDSYDYVEGVDGQPSFFDYDDPRDYEEWCDWNDVDVDEGYYDPFRPDVEVGFVSPVNVFGMDTDIVVVASAISERKHMDLRISELPGVYDNIG